jgi:hypothetical protein
MTDFKTAFDLIERRVEDRYGIAVSISDVLDPNTGDFDGVRIQIDWDQDLDSALFVLVHLFGHTVQWNTSDEYRKLGIDVTSGKSEEMLARCHEYEKNATRYSLKLMHDAGVTDLDRWVSDWWNADWAYLKHFYRTGEKLDFRSLLKPNDGELLAPLEIPEFKPTKWVSRWSF